MATAVGTFSTTSVPDTVETNEQSDAILPADFFPDKFREKKGGKTTARAEWDFFIKTYNYFPFFDRDQWDENGQPAFAGVATAAATTDGENMTSTTTTTTTTTAGADGGAADVAATTAAAMSDIASTTVLR